jgi:TRAP-type C4-dicarboxylate transport system substrate-binding protein
MYTPQIVIMSKKTWDRLSPAEQKIMREAAAEASVFQRKVARDEGVKVLDALRKSMKVIDLGPEEVARLREKAQPVIQKHTQAVGADFVAEVNAELAKVRRR